MSEIYKKKFSTSPGVKTPKPSLAPITDASRTFDARPKPTDDRRRDPHDKPTQHFDRAESLSPLDADPGLESDN